MLITNPPARFNRFKSLISTAREISNLDEFEAGLLNVASVIASRAEIDPSPEAFRQVAAVSEKIKAMMALHQPVSRAA